MQITEVSYEDDHCEVTVQPAGKEYPNLYRIYDDPEADPIYVTYEAAKGIVKAIETIQTGVLINHN